MPCCHCSACNAPQPGEAAERLRSAKGGSRCCRCGQRRRWGRQRQRAQWRGRPGRCGSPGKPPGSMSAARLPPAWQRLRRQARAEPAAALPQAGCTTKRHSIQPRGRGAAAPNDCSFLPFLPFPFFRPNRIFACASGPNSPSPFSPVPALRRAAATLYPLPLFHGSIPLFPQTNSAGTACLPERLPERHQHMVRERCRAAPMPSLQTPALPLPLILCC